ncbi:thiamine pyrophosphate-binding protein [Streptomyces incarnatus]|uniref:thiamine pyrophosphate-binding protein n=1 Tax=Streptomyces incarnatus TaxID=665007 RepID=UPI000AD00BC5|nr:thiamine pyrophosphate-binding protein [Streptomyces incarnatus]
MTIRVADYVASSLRALGVRTCYSLSGTGSIHLDQAFTQQPGLVSICARHETAAALMATGAAKLTGSLGVALVTSGPGAVNALAGLVDAYADGVPVLVISGQVETRHMDEGVRSFGVQGFGVVNSARSMTKYSAVVERPADIRLHLEEAVRHALSGRPGPVWLDIPLDVQAAQIDPDALQGSGPAPSGPRAAGARQTARQLMTMLRSAERPLIVAGQGIRQADAVTSFRHLVEQLRVPVVTSRLGTDLLPYDSEFCFGQGGIRGRLYPGLIMGRSDLVISLGSSLSTAFVGEDADAFDPDATVVAVDIDPSQLTKKGVRVDFPVCMDVGPLIEALRVEASGAPGSETHGAWLDECAGLKAAHPTVGDQRPDGPINSYGFVDRLEAQTGPDHVFVVDTGSAYYVTGQTLEFTTSQREITSAAFLNMGAAVPMAVGAAFAQPDAQVLVIVGDGAIELNIQELATISQYGLNIKVFVLNNGGYASIRESQAALTEGPQLPEPEPLDFRAVATAFRLPYRTLAHADRLDTGIASVLAEEGPALIEVICDPEQQLLRPLRADGGLRAHDGASVAHRVTTRELNHA